MSLKLLASAGRDMSGSLPSVGFRVKARHSRQWYVCMLHCRSIFPLLLCAYWTIIRGNIYSKVSKVKYVDLYSTSTRSASNALPLPYVDADLHRLYLQPGTSEHRDHGYGLVYHAIPVYSTCFRRVLIPV